MEGSLPAHGPQPVRGTAAASASMQKNMTKRKLASVDDVPPGEGRNFAVSGEKIAVFHARGGQVNATQAECPHRAGPLADGLVGGSTLICPLHSWKFDLSTRQALLGECGLKTYPVRVDPAGQIWVSV